MAKTQLEALQSVRENGGTVTYHYENGAKLVTSINPEMFTGVRNSRVSLEGILNTFKATAEDLGAVSFEI
jgi:hypothetical protein